MEMKTNPCCWGKICRFGYACFFTFLSFPLPLPHIKAITTPLSTKSIQTCFHSVHTVVAVSNSGLPNQHPAREQTSSEFKLLTDHCVAHSHPRPKGIELF
eukprot:6224465-Amphidinium_carterae.1